MKFLKKHYSLKPMPWSVLVKALDNPNNLSDEIFGESAEVDDLS